MARIIRICDVEGPSLPLNQLPCACSELQDFAVVPMGGHDGLDARVFETLENLKDHGGREWWLYLSQCSACGQGWIVAQEERIHDNYYLKRVAQTTMDQIVLHDVWPNDFMRFEDVIRLGPENAKFAVFLNPKDLTDTVQELFDDRPDISAKELSYLLCVPERKASRLMRQAQKTGEWKFWPFNSRHS